MNNPLIESLATFLKEKHDSQYPLLLAFSGGTDSLALLHLLLELRTSRHLKLAIAHVDHGWRPESHAEAKMASEIAASHHLPFHLKTLNPANLKGNLESSCREERLKFFVDICHTHSYQAVLLAHHADDLAETVLKRTLEGGFLPYLCGLRAENEIYGIKLWRPLLAHSKTLLSKYLEEKKLIAFNDPTNCDTRFLRARFRETIIPRLSKDFGKDIKPGLCRIGADAAELRSYLDGQVAPYLDLQSSGILGSYLDLSSNCPAHSLELKYLIQRFCESHELALSRDAIEKACELLRSGAANKHVATASGRLEIDRNKLFIFKMKSNEYLNNFQKIEMGHPIQFGCWKIEAHRCDVNQKDSQGWQSIWKGGSSAILPKGDYWIQMPEASSSYPGERGSLSKWWAENKVPAFLRMHIPIITDGKKIRHEFLSGRTTNELKPNIQYVILTLEYNQEELVI